MVDDSQDEQITVRVIRDGAPEPADTDWSMASAEERIEAVWTLTKLCMGWNESLASVPKLQRSVTRVQRGSKNELEGDQEAMKDRSNLYET